VRFDSNKYRHPTPPNQQLGLELLADALFEAREKRELTQHDLAFRTGVSQSTISRLEHGRAPGVSLRRLGALIAVFGGVQFGPRPLTPDQLGRWVRLDPAPDLAADQLPTIDGAE